MKKMLSVCGAVLTVIVCTGLGYAAETAKKETVPAPAASAAGEIKKEETRLAERKGKKSSKVKNVKSKPEQKTAPSKSVPLVGK